MSILLYSIISFVNKIIIIHVTAIAIYYCCHLWYIEVCVKQMKNDSEIVIIVPKLSFI